MVDISAYSVRKCFHDFKPIPNLVLLIYSDLSWRGNSFLFTTPVNDVNGKQSGLNCLFMRKLQTILGFFGFRWASKVAMILGLATQSHRNGGTKFAKHPIWIPVVGWNRSKLKQYNWLSKYLRFYFFWMAGAHALVLSDLETKNIQDPSGVSLWSLFASTFPFELLRKPIHFIMSSMVNMINLHQPAEPWKCKGIFLQWTTPLLGGQNFPSPRHT